MEYRRLSKPQQLDVLERKISELEIQHRVRSIDLIAASVTDEDTEQIERNIENLEKAIKRLHELLEEESPKKDA